MNKKWINISGKMRALLAATFLVGLAACNQAPEEQVSLDPVAFQSGDECHVCGMLVMEFPGPKGQAIDNKTGAVRKFCSTRDLLSWSLEPENRNLRATLYVHDMANSDWHHPDDRHLIDARQAFYVIGTNLPGAMGPTLASFGTREAAEKVAHEQGGQVLAFEEITPEVLVGLMDAPHHHSGGHGH